MTLPLSKLWSSCHDHPPSQHYGKAVPIPSQGAGWWLAMVPCLWIGKPLKKALPPGLPMILQLQKGREAWSWLNTGCQLGLRVLPGLQTHWRLTELVAMPIRKLGKQLSWPWVFIYDVPISSFRGLSYTGLMGFICQLKGIRFFYRVYGKGFCEH